MALSYTKALRNIVAGIASIDPQGPTEPRVSRKSGQAVGRRCWASGYAEDADR